MVHRRKRPDGGRKQKTRTRENYWHWRKSGGSRKWEWGGTTKPMRKHDMILMNTWRRNPGQTERGPNNATTWISPDGKAMMQIDFILINRRRSNFVRKARTIHAWGGGHGAKQTTLISHRENTATLQTSIFHKTSPKRRSRYPIQHPSS